MCELTTPGTQYSGPGKIIVKYILKTFTIKSCYDLRDQRDSYSRTVIKIGVWSSKYLIEIYPNATRKLFGPPCVTCHTVVHSWLGQPGDM